MINLLVKHDTAHKVWHKLSVGFPDRAALPDNMEGLAGSCWQFAMQYAIDHQMNRDLIAFRIVDKNDSVIYEYVSNATMNADTTGIKTYQRFLTSV
jgi:hypothetical protein